MIRLQNVSKHYPPPDPKADVSTKIKVIREIDLEIASGEFVAITGASGSGKTTLLSLMAGLDRANSGTVEVAGFNLSTLPEKELAIFRGRHTGFIFQNFQLLPGLTANENVALPAELIKRRGPLANEAAILLEKLGLKDRQHHYPHQLSGGEMQRVAIARALINKPSVLFADEPTGNLDSTNSHHILEILTSLPYELTLVLVTHEEQIAKLAGRRINLVDGRIEKKPISQNNGIWSTLQKNLEKIFRA